MFLSAGAAGAAIPALLANSQALFVAPFAMLLFGEALSAGRTAALLIGSAGVLLVILGSHMRLGTMEGAFLALVAAGSLAAGNLIIKRIGDRVNALSATAWQYVLGGLLLLGWSLLSEDQTTIAWSPHFLVGLLFLGLVGSGLASWVWYLLVSKGELISINSLTLLTPVFAVLLALLIYGEPLSRLSVLGMAMVLGGVVWASWPGVQER
jgi:drug/metabolite transporter (DMT)-like permease